MRLPRRGAVRTRQDDMRGTYRTVDDVEIQWLPVPEIAPWDYQPSWPFRGQAFHESMNPIHNTVEVWPVLGVMLERVTEIFLPPHFGYTVMVLDESFKLIFGYTATSVQAISGEIEWYGVRAAFEILEMQGQFDRLDLAVWEGSAMRRAA